MFKLVYVTLSCVLVLFLAGAAFLVFTFFSAKIMSFVVPPSQTEGLGMLAFGVLAALIGGIAALFSLIPSYKLSLRLAKWMTEKRGVKIENPKGLFLLAVAILFLPAVLLIIFGVMG